MINTDRIIEKIVTNEATFEYTNNKNETVKSISEILLTENYIKLVMLNRVNVYINKNEVKSLAYKDFEDAE